MLATKTKGPHYSPQIDDAVVALGELRHHRVEPPGPNGGRRGILRPCCCYCCQKNAKNLIGRGGGGRRRHTYPSAVWEQETQRMDEKIQKKVLPLIELVTRRVVQVRGRMASRGFGERGANQFLPCFSILIYGRTLLNSIYVQRIYK